VTLNELAALLKEAVQSEAATGEQPVLAAGGEEALEGSASTAEANAPIAEANPDAVAEVLLAPTAEFAAGETTVGPATADVESEADDGRKQTRKAEDKAQLKSVKARLGSVVDELIAEYAASDRGMEIRQIAGGYRMATKPEHHDVVV